MNVSEQQSVVSWKMRFLQGLRVAKFQTGKEPYKEAELGLGTKNFPRTTQIIHSRQALDLYLC